MAKEKEDKAYLHLDSVRLTVLLSHIEAAAQSIEHGMFLLDERAGDALIELDHFRDQLVEMADAVRKRHIQACWRASGREMCDRTKRLTVPDAPAAKRRQFSS